MKTPSPDNARVLIELLGLPTRCWQCGGESTALVAMRKKGVDPDDWILCTNSQTLQLAASLLPASTADVGEIKVRTSKSLGTDYVSNGCIHCDALFGNHYLYVDTTTVIFGEGIDSLQVLAIASVPEDTWLSRSGPPSR